jgi:TonB family protein
MSKAHYRHHQIILAICCLLLASATTLTVGQQPIRSERRIMLPPRHREIPEASLPCTAEETKWWQALRETASSVLKSRGGKQETRRFQNLLMEGKEKALLPPIPDSKAFVLSKTEPRYTESARRKRINGYVIVMVELRADGFVGEVNVKLGLDPGLDENAIEAARRTIFVPAVKDRKFVSSRVSMEMTFNIY